MEASIRRKALAEVYTMHSVLHLSKPNFDLPVAARVDLREELRGELREADVGLHLQEPAASNVGCRMSKMVRKTP